MHSSMNSLNISCLGFVTAGTTLLYCCLSHCIASPSVELKNQSFSSLETWFTRTKLAREGGTKYTQGVPDFVFQADRFTNGYQDDIYAGTNAYKDGSDENYSSTTDYDANVLADGYEGNGYSSGNVYVSQDVDAADVSQNDNDTGMSQNDSDTDASQNDNGTDKHTRVSQNGDVNITSVSITDIVISAITQSSLIKISNDGIAHVKTTSSTKGDTTSVSVGAVGLFDERASVHKIQSAAAEKPFQQLPDSAILSTDNVTMCMFKKKMLRFIIVDLTLSFFLTGENNDTLNDGDFRVHGNHTCWLNLTTANERVLKMSFTEQTCSKENYISLWVQVNESARYLDSRTGCEDQWSPLLYEYISVLNYALFAIVIRNLTAPYVLQINVTAEESKRALQMNYSPQIGIGKTNLFTILQDFQHNCLPR